MDVFLTILNMVLTIALAYQSGKYSAAIDMERYVFQTKPEEWMRFFWIFDLVLAVYFIFCVLGAGIRFGAGT